MKCSGFGPGIDQKLNRMGFLLILVGVILEYQIMKDNLAIYNELVAMTPSIERKGKTSPYTSSNGYMFSQLNKAGEIGIRLPKEQQKRLKEEYNAEIFKSYGAVMRDYIKVPEGLLGNLDLLSSWLTEGYNFVNSLPPKPGKK